MRPWTAADPSRSGYLDLDGLALVAMVTSRLSGFSGPSGEVKLIDLIGGHNRVFIKLEKKQHASTG